MPDAQRRRVSSGRDAERKKGGFAKLSSEDIDALLSDADNVEVFDGRKMKQTLLSLEKKITKNQMMRIKHPNEPKKFMTSELELDKEVKTLIAMATSPSLYASFTALGGVESLLGLLTHENADISLDVIEVLAELTDADVLAEDEESTNVFVNALLKHQGLELLAQNLGRIDESRSDSEAKGVFNTMTIVENIADARPDVAIALCENTTILKWLLRRICVPTFDDNKLYCSEILAILLQADRKNREMFGRLDENDAEDNEQEDDAVDAVDMLLQAVACWKSRDPDTEEEKECAENLFNALCAVLTDVEYIKDRFRHAEGFELMIRLVKQKGFCSHCALKTIDFALSDNENNASRFVDARGLKTFFYLFMGHGIRKQVKKYNISRAMIEEHIVSIAVSLATNLTGIHRDRFMGKFHEKDMEKTSRLCKIFAALSNRVRRATKKEPSALDLDEDEVYLNRLDAGLFSLQQCGLVCVAIVEGNDQLRDLLRKELTALGLSLGSVRDVVREYLDNLGEPANETRRKRNEHVKAIVGALETDLKESTMLPPPPRR